MSVSVGNYQGIKNETVLCKQGIKTSGMPAWDGALSCHWWGYAGQG
jgi:hypothetical protein